MRAVLMVVLLTGLAAGAMAEDALVKVYVDGKLQSYAPGARVRSGVTYVPLRQGATSLGFDVEWLAAENAAKICDENSCLLIRKREGIIVGGRLFLPLRKIGEAFGANVKWDGKRKAVMINKQAKKTL